jgi:hypothetical protein
MEKQNSISRVWRALKKQWMILYKIYLMERTGPFEEDNRRLALGCHSSPPPSMEQNSQPKSSGIPYQYNMA